MAKRLARPKSPHQVHQKVLGNQAMQHMLRFGMVQAKLTVNPPNDKYEQEADRVAEHMMRMPDPLRAGIAFSNYQTGIGIQRACSECDEEELNRQPLEEEMEEEIIHTKPLVNQITPLVQRQVEPELEEDEEEPFQTKPMDGLVQRQHVPQEDIETIQAEEARNSIPPITQELVGRISSLRGKGKSFSQNLRSFFEPRFGQDFSSVRIHTDSQAGETTRMLNARAFTFGRDIVFGYGEYMPHTLAGRRLLAHELTHVIQQNAAKSTKVSPNVSTLLPNKQQERVQMFPSCNRQTTGVDNAHESIVQARDGAIVIVDNCIRAVERINGDRAPDYERRAFNWTFANPNATQKSKIHRIYTEIHDQLEGFSNFVCNRQETCDSESTDTGRTTFAYIYRECNPTRTVHICPAFINSSEYQQKVSMIHEFAHLRQICSSSECYRDQACYPPPNAADVCADSYAHFDGQLLVEQQRSLGPERPVQPRRRAR